MTTENGEQMAYEPYETHIENRWDKEIVKRALERLSEGRNKTEIVRLVDEYTGPTHIVMEVQRKVERVNNVTVVDRVRSHLRRSGIRVTCTLQVILESVSLNSHFLRWMKRKRVLRSLLCFI